MWAYDFLAAEPKAKSLKTHLIANNTFARWWVSEYYVPEEMRLSSLFRLLVFAQTLSIYLVVVSQYVVYADVEYMRECRVREQCLAGCIEDNFPELPCVVNSDYKINYGGNSYSHLYEWRAKPESDDTVMFDSCRQTFPDAGKTLATKERELVGERQPRTQVCFPYCMPAVTDFLYTRNWTDDSGIHLSDIRPTEGSAECEASGKKNSLLCVDPNPLFEYCEKLEYENELCVETYQPWIHALEGEEDPACTHPIIVIIACLVAIPFQNLFDLILIFTLATIPESIQDLKANSLRCSSQCSHLLLCTVLILLLTSSVYNVFDAGRPNFMWFTWAVVMGVDQLRNIVMQTFAWYFLIRRCGQVPLMDEVEVYRTLEDGTEKLSPTQVIYRLICMLVESRRFNLATWITISLYAVYLIIVMSIDEYLSAGARSALEDGDTAFLIFFICEIMLRLAADIWYLKDVFNILDTTVIWVSFAFKFQTSESQSQLALLRLLRLLRLVLVLRKVSATKKQKTGFESGVTFSSPVERVLEIFREIKETKGMPLHLKDQIDWASDVISSNKLYSISVDLDKIKSGEGFLDQEVGDWVRLACDNAGEKTSWREVELEKLLSGRGTKKATREELVSLARDCVEDEIQECVARSNLSIADLTLDGKPMLKQAPEDDTKKAKAQKAKPEPGALVELIFEYLNREVESWSFDMHAFERWTGEKAMPLVVMQSLVRHELYDMFEILPDAMRDFLHAIESGYHKKNPYHNATHGGDVAQAFNTLFMWFINGTVAENSVLQEQELLAGLLAACIHDFEHPGFNNNFIIRTKHTMSIRYNDLSVLENHHVSSGFSVMMSLEQDPLGHCTEAQYREIRNMMISMVLATDIAHHFSELSSFKNKLNTKNFPSAKREDKQIVLDMILHSSDISNAARALPIYLHWVPRVMEEFFRQGDVELEKGMQVSMFYDRATSIPQCQKGFIEVFVLPTYLVLGQLIPEVRLHVIPNLEANHAYFCRQLGGTTSIDELNTKRGRRRKYGELFSNAIGISNKALVQSLKKAKSTIRTLGSKSKSKITHMKSKAP